MTGGAGFIGSHLAEALAARGGSVLPWGAPTGHDPDPNGTPLRVAARRD
ncbi:MAG: NAD-dependent epimerase/dehydratase family protein [Actinomycetota bacterium]|nr:NAD-dependent epimerase/dehydratase family protein [Actinomycetota bacterium]